MLGISALFALSDAIAGCGDRSTYVALDAPATAERVLMAVRRQQGHV
jgi:xanthine dehydrogenase large subunit